MITYEYNKLPFIRDKDLYFAVTNAINNIKAGWGKRKAIQTAAKARSVKQKIVTEYVNQHFPKHFWEDRKLEGMPEDAKAKAAEKKKQEAVEHKKTDGPLERYSG